MKKADPDELRSEYRREDLGPGVRGKYLDSFRSGASLALPTDEAVNDALRSFIDAAEESEDFPGNHG